MMLANLLQEIVRRRLWPIPALALLVAIAAPVLFLKSAPSGAPAADAAAPAPATAGELPARAQRLLAATAQDASRGGAKGAARDPFQPPASQVAAAADAASAGAGAGAAAGAKKATSPSSGATSSVAATKPSAGSGSTSTVTVPRAGSSADPAPSSAPTASNASVDVRFGPRANGRVHRAIARLQPYFIHGKLAAVFVKYSPRRHKAVFAVAPGLVVRGPVKCRRVEGACRYLDIPAGSYARLTMLFPGRIFVTRRLDVVAIGSGGSRGTTATAASDHGENACLLRHLKALQPSGTPIDRDACER